MLSRLRIDCALLMAVLIAPTMAVQAKSVSKTVARELRLLERDASNSKVLMVDLEPRILDILADATTPTDRGAAHKLWADALRVRRHWRDALVHYQEAVAEAPEQFADPKKSPVPYRMDMCRIEQLPEQVQKWGFITLALAVLTCLSALGRMRPGRREWAILAGWLAVSIGSGYLLMRLVDFAKVPVYPEGSKETGGHYIFVLLGWFGNPYFWGFIMYALPLATLVWLVAINRTPNRHARVVVPILLLALIACGAVFWHHGFRVIPNIYRPAATPYLKAIHMDAVGERGAMVCFALLVAAAVAATAIGLKKRANWAHLPAAAFGICLAAVVVVAFFLAANRKDLDGMNPAACYYKAPEIEVHVREHPDSFVNLTASEAETEDLKQFILKNTPTVPPEEYPKKRRDDVREEPKK